MTNGSLRPVKGPGQVRGAEAFERQIVCQAVHTLDGVKCSSELALPGGWSTIHGLVANDYLTNYSSSA